MLGWFKQKLKKLAYGAPVKREVGSVSFSRDGHCESEGRSNLFE
jgi:hypothetical protein